MFGLRARNTTQEEEEEEGGEQEGGEDRQEVVHNHLCGLPAVDVVVIC